MGLEQAAKDYGFKSQTVGPAKADAALQAQMVEDYIAKGVQAIAVCPNDPASIEPVFAKQMVPEYLHSDMKVQALKMFHLISKE